MDAPPLFQQIAASIRQEILEGKLKPAGRLPTVRQAAKRWGCTLNTIQRAYQELARQGLVTSRTGSGTFVTAPDTRPARQTLRQDAPLRKAGLVHRAESFLLEVLTAGFTPAEVDEAFKMAMERWQVIQHDQLSAPAPANTLRFTGSHDLSVLWLSGHFGEIAPGWRLETTFAGSLGGLIALSEGKPGLAGAHLWDAETGEYNAPFVRRLLPGRKTALVGLAYRRQGWITAPACPYRIKDRFGLLSPGLRFANRQAGSGTRVWLDAQLQADDIPTGQIQGYDSSYDTHSAVARAVAEGKADVGLGLEGAALAFGLDFIPVMRERYDLIIPAEAWVTPPVQALVSWLSGPRARQVIASLDGYEAGCTGEVAWV